MSDYSVGEGWHSLIDPVAKRAEEEGVKIRNVKEKFGALRIVSEWDKASDELKAMIAEAEGRSKQICEECGDAGSSVDLGGWIKTLCPYCHHKLEQDLPSYE